MQRITATTLLDIFKKHCYISTDSRKVMPGSIFFALKGDNFNANQFASQALQNGAAYAVIDDPEMYINDKTLLVDDVLKSLQQLASLYRSTLKIPIIGITGTNGKTTTKELVATALSTRFQTVFTHGNFNNHIGVPLTVLSIRPDTEMAVIELGANHQGEIAELSHIARPTHGLITNIGKAHLEGFGGFEGVIKTKKELYDYLNEHGGRVFVNSNNELLMKLSSQSHRITYGMNVNDEVAGIPGTNALGYLTIDLLKPIKKRLETNLAGIYNFENVMAALCIVHQFRVNFSKAIDAIASYQPEMNRSQIFKTTKNLLLLDAYNANPTSMYAAIVSFSKMESKNKIIILGDMFELGKESETEHDTVLRLVNEYNFKNVYTAGPHFYKSAEVYPFIKKYANTLELTDALKAENIVNSTILIKGSRGMKLESVKEVL